jgi:hypothetical protein
MKKELKTKMEIEALFFTFNWLKLHFDFRRIDKVVILDVTYNILLEDCGRPDENEYIQDFRQKKIVIYSPHGHQMYPVGMRTVPRSFIQLLGGEKRKNIPVYFNERIIDTIDRMKITDIRHIVGLSESGNEWVLFFAQMPKGVTLTTLRQEARKEALALVDEKLSAEKV